MRTFLTYGAAALLALPSACRASPPSFTLTDPHSPLGLEKVIPLPDTDGRIDHLAIDLTGQRLFVAEVANGTVDMIDLHTGKVVSRIKGLQEPQGITWLPAVHEIVVACGDGTVHFYDPKGVETASVALGDDADNVQVDDRNGQVVVGYGSGGLATIDPVSHNVVQRITFKGHPEGFRLLGGRALVNVPDDESILAIDRDGGRVAARWSTGMDRLNFPMALDGTGRTAAVAYRLPASLARIDTDSGKVTASLPICGDADDLFFDEDRAVVVCGSGHVAMVRGSEVEAVVGTSAGARTGLFVPELETLFLAVPKRQNSAAVWAIRVRRVG